VGSARGGGQLLKTKRTCASPAAGDLEKKRERNMGAGSTEGERFETITVFLLDRNQERYPRQKEGGERRKKTQHLRQTFENEEPG